MRFDFGTVRFDFLTSSSRAQTFASVIARDDDGEAELDVSAKGETHFAAVKKGLFDTKSSSESS